MTHDTQSPHELTRQPYALPQNATGITTLVALAALVIFAAGLKNMSSIAGPTFLALSLVLAVRPFHKWMVNKGLNKLLAAGIALIVLYGVLVAMIAALTYSLVALIQILPSYTDKFETLYQQAFSFLKQFGISQTQISDQLLNYLEPSRIMSWASTALSGFSAAGSLLFMVIMVLAFLVADSAIISGRGSFLRKHQPNLSYAIEDFTHRTSRYWVVNTIFGLIVAVIDVVALMILGVPLSLVWGILSFVTNYIPNVGFILGLVPPALIALLDGDWTKMLWVVVLYSVINFTMQQIVQPKVTGDAVGLNTTVTFLSLMIWALIIGPLGAILAVPLTLFFKSLLIDADPRTRWMNVFLTTDFKKGAKALQLAEESTEEIEGQKVPSNIDPNLVAEEKTER